MVTMQHLMWVTSCIYFLLIKKLTAISEKPHIIVIIADDVGWNDFGFHGSSQIPTPNIDALAYNGVVLNTFYTQHACTPSRAAFLTGKYAFRSGLQGIPLSAGEDRGIPADVATLPERLQKLNYATHLVGKWHLGAASRNNTPTNRGFTSHFGYWNGYVGYFNYMVSEPVNTTKNYTGFDLHYGLDPQWQYQGEYSTHLFTKKSLDIIENHNESKPLFLVLSHLAAHTGYQGTELGVPDIETTERKYHYIDQPERRRTADIINIMDQSIGKLMEKLSEKKMLENSIILFFSDNGAQTIGGYQNFASGWPLRGLKFTLFEGGVRGSCVIYSPLFNKQGYINNELIHISDLMPTLYYAAGGNLSDLGEIDGINQWNVISRNESTNRTEILLNIDEVENLSGILGYNGRYKLLNGTYRNGIFDQHYGDSGRSPKTPPYNIQEIIKSPANEVIQKLTNHEVLSEEIIERTRRQLIISSCNDQSDSIEICNGYCLFDLKHDPCERKNIINETNNQIVSDLQNKLRLYWNELVPQSNKPVDVISDPSNCNNTWYNWLDGPRGCILQSHTPTLIEI